MAVCSSEHIFFLRWHALHIPTASYVRVCHVQYSKDFAVLLCHHRGNITPVSLFNTKLYVTVTGKNITKYEFKKGGGRLNITPDFDARLTMLHLLTRAQRYPCLCALHAFLFALWERRK